MKKVIETNISLDNMGQQADFQSRVIEVESWELFIEEIKSGKSVTRNCKVGSSFGTSVPRFGKISNLKFDENHISCDITNIFGLQTRKLAYLVNE